MNLEGTHEDPLIPVEAPRADACYEEGSQIRVIKSIPAVEDPVIPSGNSEPVLSISGDPVLGLSQVAAWRAR